MSVLFVRWSGVRNLVHPELDHFFQCLGGTQFHIKNSILPRKVFSQLADHCDIFQRFSPHCIDEIGHFQRALPWKKNLEIDIHVFLLLGGFPSPVCHAVIALGQWKMETSLWWYGSDSDHQSTWKKRFYNETARKLDTLSTRSCQFLLQERLPFLLVPNVKKKGNPIFSVANFCQLRANKTQCRTNNPHRWTNPCAIDSTRRSAASRFQKGDKVTQKITTPKFSLAFPQSSPWRQFLFQPENPEWIQDAGIRDITCHPTGHG